MTERCSKYSHFLDKSNKVKGLKCNDVRHIKCSDYDYREERSQEKFLEEEEYSSSLSQKHLELDLREEKLKNRNLELHIQEIEYQIKKKKMKGRYMMCN